VIPDGAWRVWALGRQGDRVRAKPRIDGHNVMLGHAALRTGAFALSGPARCVHGGPGGAGARALPGGLDLVFQQRWAPSSGRMCASIEPGLLAQARYGAGSPGCHAGNLDPKPGIRGQPGLWMGVGGSFDVGRTKKEPPADGSSQIECCTRLYFRKTPPCWRRMLSPARVCLGGARGG